MQFDLDKDVRYGLAYSGGVDSCYLLAELLREGYDVKAYTILDDLQITRDTDDSVTIAKMLGAEQEIIPINIWDGHEDLRANPWDRCYHCKSMVFGTILEHMRADGRTVLLDGTNASDREDRRPGFRAIHELGVRCARPASRRTRCARTPPSWGCLRPTSQATPATAPTSTGTRPSRPNR